LRGRNRDIYKGKVHRGRTKSIHKGKEKKDGDRGKW